MWLQPRFYTGGSPPAASMWPQPGFCTGRGPPPTAWVGLLPGFYTKGPHPAAPPCLLARLYVGDPASATCSQHWGSREEVLIYGPRKEDTVPASGTPGAPHPSLACTGPWGGGFNFVGILMQFPLKFLQKLYKNCQKNFRSFIKYFFWSVFSIFENIHKLGWNLTNVF